MYLRLYNFIQYSAWWLLFVYQLYCLTPPAAFAAIESLQIVQCLAFLEIVHSALKLTKNPLLPSLLQTGARIFYALFVLPFYLQQGGSQWAVAAIILTWSTAEIIRYSYYIFSHVSLIRWLRYNSFLLLYPAGIMLELFVCFNLIYQVPLAHSWVFWLVIASYPLLAPQLLGYMWKQRKKYARRLFS